MVVELLVVRIVVRMAVQMMLRMAVDTIGIVVVDIAVVAACTGY